MHVSMFYKVGKIMCTQDGLWIVSSYFFFNTSKLHNRRTEKFNKELQNGVYL